MFKKTVRIASYAALAHYTYHFTRGVVSGVKTELDRQANTRRATATQ